MKITKLFEKEPKGWGLRGDPYLWRELKKQLDEMSMPKTEIELQQLLERQYQKITGKALNKQGYIKIDNFKHGGMSSGMISPQFWKDIGFPLLVNQWQEIHKIS